MLGTKEERTKGMKRQAQELIDQAYERGYKARKEAFVGTEAKVVNEAYQRGLDDAWECARKIVCKPGECGGLESTVLYKMFEIDTEHGILRDFIAAEAIAKIKAYEEQKKAEEEEIKVGDEVIRFYTDTNDTNYKGVVSKVSEKNLCIVWDDGSVGYFGKNIVKKTGRHFDKIAEVVKQLREGE